jgi:predicted component of type VI protein secretion system
VRSTKAKRPTKDLRSQIQEEIAQFTLLALLDLLENMGYEQKEIMFRGHNTQVSQSSFLNSIEFFSRPKDCVVVTVNMGLLSANSPLPSYFLLMLERADIDEQLYVDFLDYFNHQLVLNYIMSQAPTRELTIYPDWENTKSCYLAMAGLKSTSTLHWLFKKIFPELDIEVKKAPFNEELTVDTVQVGTPYKLGSAAVFGSRSTVVVMGFEAILYTEEEFLYPGRAWAREIEDRLLNIIFGVFAGAEINLRVFLVITSQQGGARLGSESYLGYDKIVGGENQLRQICLFSGEVP